MNAEPCGARIVMGLVMVPVKITLPGLISSTPVAGTELMPSAMVLNGLLREPISLPTKPDDTHTARARCVSRRPPLVVTPVSVASGMAALRMRLLTVCHVVLGKRLMIRAAAPETNGADSEVPEASV